MFTGIIEEVGAIARRAGSDITIAARAVIDGVRQGDSIAVDGVCLTVTAFDAHGFSVQVSPETYSNTTLGAKRVGDGVNLERAMAANGRFDGHMVQGHVDGVGSVISVDPQGDFALWRFRAPDAIARYLVPKGAVAVDGISLTVVDPRDDTFGVAIIPISLERTTLQSKKSGDPVNLEADIVGKYIYHYLKGNASGSLSIETLKRHGYAS